ncbi:HSP90 family protein [Sphingobacterium multivorum]|uniref:HSP90 family protein n=1 Tax=Sphingobacterium multivorum TaxID=28454 RepID=UPI0028AEA70F|nr:HSP90 family protein [Sphingobacterium multivorum]
MQEEKSYSFQVNLKGMIALLSEHLYSDPNTFIRELLQNGVDAITALKHLDEQHQGKITIELPGTEQPKFLFSDNGIGLKEADIHQFLSVIGESSKSKDIKDAQDFIGKFGIGLLSCFVVSDEIIVETKSALEQLPLRWTARAEGDYKIERLTEDIPVGTRVILSPKKQFSYIFEGDYFEKKIKFYGDALRETISIVVGGAEKIIHKEAPKWLAPSVSKAELLAIGKELFHVNFLDAIPFETTAGKAKGVLYILPFRTQFSSKQRHRIYLKRMFLAEEDQSILPNWAFFVRMLVNTEELSATASRESLMKNDLLRQARKEIAAVLKTYLQQVKKIDFDIYIRIIQTHYLHLKAFALDDPDFLAIFLADIPFETNRGQRSFQNIIDQQQQLYYCADFEDFKQIDRMADTQGMILVNASYTFDTELLRKIKQRYPDYKITEMSPNQLLETFQPIHEDEQNQYVSFQKEAQSILDDYSCILEIRRFKPIDTPAIFTKMDQNSVESTISQLKENANPFAQVLKTSRPNKIQNTLCLNADNQLISTLMDIKDAYMLRSVIEVLYVQALILGKYPVQEREMKVMNEALKSLIVMGLDNFVNL